MRRSMIFAAATSGALFLTACQTSAPTPRPRPRPPRSGPASEDAASRAAYVTTAGSIDLFVVRACALALERSSDAGIRALATRLAEEHRGMAAQLSLAGRRLDTLPAARLLAREEQRFASLQTQQPFDTAFVRQMMVTHEQSLSLHAAFAARGTSPTLRPVAANALRVERAHLAVLAGR